MIALFCCNDLRGVFTGQVEIVEFADLLRLVCQKPRPPTMRMFDLDVKIGRHLWPCWDWQHQVGNVYWNAAKMKTGVARGLVVNLLRNGWTVEEWADAGPLADLVPRREIDDLTYSRRFGTGAE